MNKKYVFRLICDQCFLRPTKLDVELKNANHMNAPNPGFTVMMGSTMPFKTIIQINLIKPVEIGFNCLPD